MTTVLCSCKRAMDVYSVHTEEQPQGVDTDVCGHCDLGGCDVKHCALCRNLTQADAHNTKT